MRPVYFLAVYIIEAVPSIGFLFGPDFTAASGTLIKVLLLVVFHRLITKWALDRLIPLVGNTHCGLTEKGQFSLLPSVF